MGKMRGRDKALGLEGGGGRENRRMFKKGDISGNEVSMCIGRITSVLELKAGITKEDALRSLSRKFISARIKYVDKNKYIRKHMEGDKKGVDYEREENEELDHPGQKRACD